MTKTDFPISVGDVTYYIEVSQNVGIYVCKCLVGNEMIECEGVVFEAVFNALFAALMDSLGLVAVAFQKYNYVFEKVGNGVKYVDRLQPFNPISNNYEYKDLYPIVYVDKALWANRISINFHIVATNKLL